VRIVLLRLIMRVVWVRKVIIVIDRLVLDNDYKRETSEHSSWIAKGIEFRRVDKHLHLNHQTTARGTDTDDFVLIVDLFNPSMIGDIFVIQETEEDIIGDAPVEVVSNKQNVDVSLPTKVGSILHMSSCQEERYVKTAKSSNHGIGIIDFDMIPVIETQISLTAKMGRSE